MVEGSTEDQRALSETLELVASYPQSGKPSKTWLATADRVLDTLDDAPGLVSALLDGAVAADDVVEHHQYANGDYTSVNFAVGGHEQILCGIATLAGRLGSGRRSTGCAGWRRRL